jgi:hypothetical protein
VTSHQSFAENEFHSPLEEIATILDSWTCCVNSAIDLFVRGIRQAILRAMGLPAGSYHHAHWLLPIRLGWRAHNEFQ